jgi:hypothetical protein
LGRNPRRSGLLLINLTGLRFVTLPIPVLPASGANGIWVDLRTKVRSMLFASG